MDWILECFYIICSYFSFMIIILSFQVPQVKMLRRPYFPLVKGLSGHGKWGVCERNISILFPFRLPYTNSAPQAILSLYWYLQPLLLEVFTSQQMDDSRCISCAHLSSTMYNVVTIPFLLTSGCFNKKWNVQISVLRDFYWNKFPDKRKWCNILPKLFFCISFSYNKLNTSLGKGSSWIPLCLQYPTQTFVQMSSWMTAHMLRFTTYTTGLLWDLQREASKLIRKLLERARKRD